MDDEANGEKAKLADLASALLDLAFDTHVIAFAKLVEDLYAELLASRDAKDPSYA